MKAEARKMADPHAICCWFFPYLSTVFNYAAYVSSHGRATVNEELIAMWNQGIV
jgi:hypothetical protein